MVQQNHWAKYEFESKCDLCPSIHFSSPEELQQHLSTVKSSQDFDPFTHKSKRRKCSYCHVITNTPRDLLEHQTSSCHVFYVPSPLGSNSLDSLHHQITSAMEGANDTDVFLNNMERWNTLEDLPGDDQEPSRVVKCPAFRCKRRRFTLGELRQHMSIMTSSRDFRNTFHTTTDSGNYCSYCQTSFTSTSLLESHQTFWCMEFTPPGVTCQSSTPPTLECVEFTDKVVGAMLQSLDNDEDQMPDCGDEERDGSPQPDVSKEGDDQVFNLIPVTPNPVAVVGPLSSLSDADIMKRHIEDEILKGQVDQAARHKVEAHLWRHQIEADKTVKDPKFGVRKGFWNGAPERISTTVETQKEKAKREALINKDGEVSNSLLLAPAGNSVAELLGRVLKRTKLGINYSCEKCGSKFTSELEHSKHVCNHGNHYPKPDITNSLDQRGRKCFVCCHTFRTKLELLRHLSIMEISPDFRTYAHRPCISAIARPFSCSWCKGHFRNRQSFETHQLEKCPRRKKEKIDKRISQLVRANKMSGQFQANKTVDADLWRRQIEADKTVKDPKFGVRKGFWNGAPEKISTTVENQRLKRKLKNYQTMLSQEDVAKRHEAAVHYTKEPEMFNFSNDVSKKMQAILDEERDKAAQDLSHKCGRCSARFATELDLYRHQVVTAKSVDFDENHNHVDRMGMSSVCCSYCRKTFDNSRELVTHQFWDCAVVKVIGESFLKGGSNSGKLRITTLKVRKAGRVKLGGPNIKPADGTTAAVKLPTSTAESAATENQPEPSLPLTTSGTTDPDQTPSAPVEPSTDGYTVTYPVTYSCTVCPFDFLSPEELVEHNGLMEQSRDFDDKHDYISTEGSDFKCSYCNKSFTEIESLMEHQLDVCIQFRESLET
eukprot:sb/3461921/